jgi:hypothetical protein
MGQDSWIVTYGEIRLDAVSLVSAAKELHRAIRAVIDPEALRDIHGSRPMVKIVI